MLNICRQSSLAKIFRDAAPAGVAFCGASLLLGEACSFQAAFVSDTPALVEARLEGSGAAFCQAFWVEDAPAPNPCYEDSDDYYLSKQPGLYPDVLRPARAPLAVEAGQWHSLWVTLRAEEASAAPLQVVVVLRDAAGQEARAEYSFAQIPIALPPQRLLCTDWFHGDCLATRYNVPVFSEAHWELLRKYILCAAEHGVNFLLTPLFTLALDTEVGGERPTMQLVTVTRQGERYTFEFTRLGRWFALCESCGIRHFELSHLFTQWGAKAAPKVVATVEDGSEQRIFGWETDADSAAYTDFLTQLAAALLPYLEAQGVRERCYIHVSDEPSPENIESYARHSELLHRIFPGVPVMDALSSLTFYQQGLLEQPIPATDHIAPFIGRVPSLWAYYCCGQHKGYLANRFMAMPSQRNRVLGFQLWKFDCKGFLHWGFNFWYAILSKREIDPFTETAAEDAYPAGDAYSVYPGQGGEPLPSLRLKVFHEALQDQRALELLESLCGKAAALALLEEGLAQPLDFNTYPHDEAWQLATRTRINQAIAAQLCVE
jgi:hypothetical protein